MSNNFVGFNNVLQNGRGTGTGGVARRLKTWNPEAKPIKRQVPPLTPGKIAGSWPPLKPEVEDPVFNDKNYTFSTKDSGRAMPSQYYSGDGWGGRLRGTHQTGPTQDGPYRTDKSLHVFFETKEMQVNFHQEFTKRAKEKSTERAKSHHDLGSFVESDEYFDLYKNTALELGGVEKPKFGYSHHEILHLSGRDSIHPSGGTVDYIANDNNSLRARIPASEYLKFNQENKGLRTRAMKHRGEHKNSEDNAKKQFNHEYMRAKKNLGKHGNKSVYDESIRKAKDLYYRSLDLADDKRDEALNKILEENNRKAIEKFPYLGKEKRKIWIEREKKLPKQARAPFPPVANKGKRGQTQFPSAPFRSPG